jgi:NAD(P)-dependent dehydrogenase (short-subunit alcohol dehydrogenase family)
VVFSTGQKPSIEMAEPELNDTSVSVLEPESIAEAVRILGALAAEPALHMFLSPKCRDLRKVMRPLVEVMVAKEPSTEQRIKREVSKAARTQLKAAECKQKALEAKYINSVKLRAARYERLEELKRQAAVAEHGATALLIPDGPADVDAPRPGAAQIEDVGGQSSCDSITVPSQHDATPAESRPRLERRPRSCYVCKTRFFELHEFYDQLCPACAALNWLKRHQSADMSGRVVLVTGGRVKIGFYVVLKLLRAGALVVMTTRFPRDAAIRFCAEARHEAGSSAMPAWLSENRLWIVSLDLRDMQSIESFAAMLEQRFGRLDAIVHNACQTVRRPPAYYADLVAREMLPAIFVSMPVDGGAAGEQGVQLPLPSAARPMLEQGAALLPSLSRTPPIRVVMASPDLTTDDGPATARESVGVVRTEVMVQQVCMLSLVPLVPGDDVVDDRLADRGPDGVVGRSLFPRGAVDVNAQQLDLRRVNSWTLPIDDVSTVEAAEALAINALAPFALNSRLIPLLRKTGRTGRKDGALLDTFIVNVSAMEGKFYRNKTPMHPHTNMAKAALNMMTRTCSAALATDDRIHMNSVDTGWINDENPLDRAAAHATKANFQTPLDEIDAAARILDPIFSGVATGHPVHGLFLKDYHETEW